MNGYPSHKYRSRPHRPSSLLLRVRTQPHIHWAEAKPKNPLGGIFNASYRIADRERDPQSLYIHHGSMIVVIGAILSAVRATPAAGAYQEAEGSGVVCAECPFSKVMDAVLAAFNPAERRAAADARGGLSRSTAVAPARDVLAGFRFAPGFAKRLTDGRRIGAPRTLTVSRPRWVVAARSWHNINLLNHDCNRGPRRAEPAHADGQVGGPLPGRADDRRGQGGASLTAKVLVVWCSSLMMNDCPSRWAYSGVGDHRSLARSASGWVRWATGHRWSEGA